MSCARGLRLSGLVLVHWGLVMCISDEDVYLRYLSPFPGNIESRLALKLPPFCHGLIRVSSL